MIESIKFCIELGQSSLKFGGLFWLQMFLITCNVLFIFLTSSLCSRLCRWILNFFVCFVLVNNVLLVEQDFGVNI